MTPLTLDNGGSIDFDDVGRGPAIVFLHGWSLGKDAFSLQRKSLRDRFRVVVPDMRGHGRSSRFANGDGIPALADDVGRLLEHLDLCGVVIVGWSMGALVAWELATGPEAHRVAGLVTIDMVPRVLNGEDWQHGLRAGSGLYDVERDLDRMQADWHAYAKAYVPHVFAADASERRAALTDRMLELIEGNDVGSMMRLWRTLVDADYIDVATSLELPTLITYGRKSQVYDEAAATWMHEHLPKSELLGFDDSGHAPHLEEPERFNEALARFTHQLTDSKTHS